jgi:hypothetical protein
MHLHIYRDESRSGHVDLVGDGDHPWSIDLITMIAAAIMLVGFAAALAARLVH